MSEELLNCPFCGARPQMVDAYDAADDLEQLGGKWWQVQCRECGVRTLRYLAKTAVRGVWNRRYKPTDAD